MCNPLVNNSQLNLISYRTNINLSLSISQMIICIFIFIKLFVVFVRSIGRSVSRNATKTLIDVDK